MATNGRSSRSSSLGRGDTRPGRDGEFEDGPAKGMEPADQEWQDGDEHHGTVRAKKGGFAAPVSTGEESGTSGDEQVWMSTPAKQRTEASGITWMAAASVMRNGRLIKGGSDGDASSETESGGVRPPTARNLLNLDSLVLPSMSSSSSSSVSSIKRRRVALPTKSLLQASLPPSGGASFSDDEFADEFQTVSGKAAFSTGEEATPRRSQFEGETPSVAGSTLVNSDDQVQRAGSTSASSAVSSASKARRKSSSPFGSNPPRSRSALKTSVNRHPISAFELDLPRGNSIRNAAPSSTYSPTLTSSSTLPTRSLSSSSELRHGQLPSTLDNGDSTPSTAVPPPFERPRSAASTTATVGRGSRLLESREGPSPSVRGARATDPAEQANETPDEAGEEEEEESPPFRSFRTPLADRISSLFDAAASTSKLNSPSFSGRRPLRNTSAPNSTSPPGPSSARIANLFDKMLETPSPAASSLPSSGRQTASAAPLSPFRHLKGRVGVREDPHTDARPLSAVTADSTDSHPSRRRSLRGKSTETITEEPRQTPHGKKSAKDIPGLATPAAKNSERSMYATPLLGTAHLPRSGWRTAPFLTPASADGNDSDSAEEYAPPQVAKASIAEPPRRSSPWTPASTPLVAPAQTPAVTGAYPRTPAPPFRGARKGGDDLRPTSGDTVQRAEEEFYTPAKASKGDKTVEFAVAGEMEVTPETPSEPEPRRRPSIASRIEHFAASTATPPTPYVPGHLRSSIPTTPAPPSSRVQAADASLRQTTPSTPLAPGHLPATPRRSLDRGAAPPSPPDMEDLIEAEPVLRHHRRTSTPPKLPRVRFDEDVETAQVPGTSQADKSSTTPVASPPRATVLSGLDAVDLHAYDGLDEEAEVEASKEEVEQRVNGLLDELAVAVHEMGQSAIGLDSLADSSLFSNSSSSGSSPQHRAILSALANSSAGTAKSRATILARLRAADEEDRSLELKVDEIRRSVEGMGGRLADAVRAGFQEEGGRRKRWLVGMIVAELLVIWCMFLFAASRASYLFQTVYFDPFHSALYQLPPLHPALHLAPLSSSRSDGSYLSIFAPIHHRGANRSPVAMIALALEWLGGVVSNFAKAGGSPGAAGLLTPT